MGNKSFKNSSHFAAMLPLYIEKDAVKWEALMEKMKEETFPKFLIQVGRVSSAAA